MSPGERARRWILLLVWAASAVFVLDGLDRGWIPHDEGTLAQSAERVMRGEVPHRDFDEPYTGGLSVVNAAAFKAFGTNLLSPRLVLFGVFLLWVPTVFYVATRFVSPWIAGLGTLLAVAYSLPNYSAAMPSWYNLFLAVFTAAALLRHVETGRRRWLFAAGLLAGLSILVKIAGLYVVAGGLLFLVYRERALSEEIRPGVTGGQKSRAYSIVITLGIVLFLCLLAGLVRDRAGVEGIVHFVAPSAVVGGLLVAWEWTGRRGPGSGERIRRLAGLVLPFLAGVLLPVAALAGVYVGLGALDDLARGVLVLPRTRLTDVLIPPPPPSTLGPILVVVGLLLVEAVLARWARWGLAALVLAASALTVVADRPGAAFGWVWHAMTGFNVAAVTVGCVLLERWRREDVDPGIRQGLMVLLSVAAVFGLIQFPTYGPIYILNVVPLSVLVFLAIQARSRPLRRPVLLAVPIFFLLFTLRWVNTGRPDAAGRLTYEPKPEVERLRVERGGIRVNRRERQEYEELVALLQETSESPFIFATPDAPEVYFLSGLRNPTRTFFDFFDEREGRTARILDAVDAHEVNVVVLNTRFHFSGPPPPELLKALRQRFPWARRVGQKFLVRWSRSTPADEP